MGCILYELVVGQPPFPAEKMIELCQKVKSCDIFWPDSIQGDCLSFLKVRAFFCRFVPVEKLFD